MKKRLISCLLILILLTAVLPIPTAFAGYGPGYTTRAELAFQYLVGYIQQNGQYPNGAASGDFKSIDTPLSPGVTFQMTESEIDNHTLSFSLLFEDRDENDPYFAVYGMVSLTFVNGYWLHQDNWIDVSDYVSGWYYYDRSDKNGSLYVDLTYKVLPRLFSEQAGLTKYVDYIGPEGEKEAYRHEATLGVNDILTLLEQILTTGGYSLRDLGFSAYQGHKTHRFWTERETTPPTCESMGRESKTCYVCGNEVTNVIPALGHSWNEGEVTGEPSCVQDGVKQYECARCGETKDETIPALGHVWTLTEVLTEEESAHASMGLYTCSRCNETKEARLCAAEVFTDMPAEGNWAHAPIDWAYFDGITAGKTANTFAPKYVVTRAEAMTFLWKVMGSPEPETQDNPFTDVPEGKYFYKPVMWAVENGVTSGATETTFAPKQKCSRAQIMMFLWAAAGKPEPDTEENPFTDVSENKYYYKAVLWAVENGITGGIAADKFGPNNTCTRAQIVTFLYKAQPLLTTEPDPDPALDPITP